MTEAERHAPGYVWAKTGKTLFFAHLFFFGASPASKRSDCDDAHDDAEGFSRTDPTHPPGEGLFDISTSASAHQYQELGNMAGGGAFFAFKEWDVGGIQIFDMESEPVALRTSGFDSMHLYIPRSLLNTFSDESELQRIHTLQCIPGTRDDVLLHWARMLLPYFDRTIHLPRLVLDEWIMLLCAHLARTYQDLSQAPEVVPGGLAFWQQDRAIELLNAHLDGDLALADLAEACGLSSGRFMRGFKKSFGVPVRRYLLHKRVDAAKSLLLRSNESLLTIALKVGFSDQPAFNRSFRLIVGTSPGQWRRSHAPMPKVLRLPASDYD